MANFSETPAARVLMWPTNSGTNPYIELLVSALEAANCRVSTPRFGTVFRKYDAFHMHWPDWTIRDRPWPLGLFRLVVFTVFLLFMRARNIRVVWTVHNLAPHGGAPKWLTRSLYLVLRKSVDLQIHLSSATSVELSAIRHPCARQSRVVIPHGLYRPDTAATMPPEYDRDANVATAISALGSIQPYKGIEELVAASAGLQESHAVVIAGAPGSHSYIQRIATSIQNDTRFVLIPREITESEYEGLLTGSKLVVAPYQAVLNSGSVIRALSSGAPVLTPSTPTLEDLARTFPSLVFTYEAPLTSARLRLAISTAPSTERHPPAPPPGWDWESIATNHIRAYVS